jgi:hypothetical protein
MIVGSRVLTEGAIAQSESIHDPPISLRFEVDTGHAGHHKSATERSATASALQNSLGVLRSGWALWGNVPSGKGGGL